MSDEKATRAMALERWRLARTIAQGLVADLTQEENCWLLLRGDTARSLAWSLLQRSIERLDDIRRELEEAEHIWSLQERLIEHDP